LEKDYIANFQPVEGKVFAFMEMVVGVYSVKLKILKNVRNLRKLFVEL